MKLASKADGFKYYGHVLCYIDDVLAIDEHPRVVIESLKSTYKLKPSSIGPPDQYLGSQIKKLYIQNSDEPGKVQ
jgi:hypothetical protein